MYLGGTQILEIALDNTTAETIIISGSKMNAYNESGAYMNRQVTGDYDNLVFKAGVNNRTIEGTITSVLIDDYSRWI